jgi:hypothetical protein
LGTISILGGSGELVEARRARAARLAALTYKEMLGLTGFTAELNPGGLLPKEAVQRSLRLLTEEVMPAFK